MMMMMRSRHTVTVQSVYSVVLRLGLPLLIGRSGGCYHVPLTCILWLLLAFTSIRVCVHVCVIKWTWLITFTSAVFGNLIFTIRRVVCLSVCLSVYLCVLNRNRLLNHATQQDKTLYEGVNKSREGHCEQLIRFRFSKLICKVIGKSF